MKAAIVAVEDRRFYQHQGVDWQGTIRAVVANSASGDVVQGASTLTQQYVKNYLLYVEAQTEAERLKATEQTPARKLREARIALQMERSLSKEDILARYLNIVFWGNGAYGVSAAARTYFNTTADQLTVAQAALLAGMVRSTTQFDPVANPEAALDRRNLVIVADAGAGDDRRGPGAAGAGRSRWGSRTRWAPGKNGCIGAGDAGFFCKYVTDYLAEAGVPDDADPARRVHDQDHPGPRRDGEDEGVAERRGARGRGERGRRDGHRGARPGPAPGAGDGLEPHVRARRRQRRRPATGCRTSRSTWAPGRCTRSSPRPRRWRRGWASTTDDGAAVRLRLADLRRRERAADPGEQRRQLRRPSCRSPTRWRSRRTPRSSSSRSSPGSRTWWTWRCGWA